MPLGYPEAILIFPGKAGDLGCEPSTAAIECRDAILILWRHA
jgi:hypothetical protein